jgi:hypothetical protein
LPGIRQEVAGRTGILSEGIARLSLFLRGLHAFHALVALFTRSSRGRRAFVTRSSHARHALVTRQKDQPAVAPEQVAADVGPAKKSSQDKVQRTLELQHALISPASVRAQVFGPDLQCPFGRKTSYDQPSSTPNSENK